MNSLSFIHVSIPFGVSDMVLMKSIVLATPFLTLIQYLGEIYALPGWECKDSTTESTESIY